MISPMAIVKVYRLPAKFKRLSGLRDREHAEDVWVDDGA